MAVLTTEQAARLLDHIRHQRVYWPVLIALSTGMRRGEILALRWRHIDLDRGAAQVLESLEHTKVGGLRFKRPKNNRTRGISLPDFAVEELRRRKREQAEELLKPRRAPGWNHAGLCSRRRLSDAADEPDP